MHPDKREISASLFSWSGKDGVTEISDLQGLGLGWNPMKGFEVVVLSERTGVRKTFQRVMDDPWEDAASYASADGFTVTFVND